MLRERSEWADAVRRQGLIYQAPHIPSNLCLCVFAADGASWAFQLVGFGGDHRGAGHVDVLSDL